MCYSLEGVKFWVIRTVINRRYNNPISLDLETQLSEYFIFASYSQQKVRHQTTYLLGLRSTYNCFAVSPDSDLLGLKLLAIAV